MCRVDGSHRNLGASPGGGNDETPSFTIRPAKPLRGDTDRWAVWVGRHSLEKITRELKGQLR